MILTRKDLHEAVWYTLSLAAVIGLALPFRDRIEAYVGVIPMRLIFGGAGLLLILSIGNLIDGWLLIRTGERQKRKQKEEEKREQAEWERQDQEQQAEWEAFPIG
jgi:hypothetical protein